MHEVPEVFAPVIARDLVIAAAHVIPHGLPDWAIRRGHLVNVDSGR
jgi:hypothetical protein